MPLHGSASVAAGEARSRSPCGRPGRSGRPASSTVSPSQSSATETTRWRWPDVSPLTHCSCRLRLKYVASPVARVRPSAARSIQASMSTSPVAASCAIAGTSPPASKATAVERVGVRGGVVGHECHCAASGAGGCIRQSRRQSLRWAACQPSILRAPSGPNCATCSKKWVRTSPRCARAGPPATSPRTWSSARAGPTPRWESWAGRWPRGPRRSRTTPRRSPTRSWSHWCAPARRSGRTSGCPGWTGSSTRSSTTCTTRMSAAAAPAGRSGISTPTLSDFLWDRLKLAGRGWFGKVKGGVDPGPHRRRRRRAQGQVRRLRRSP